MAPSPEGLRIGLFSNAYRPLISGVVNSIDLIRKELLQQGHTPWIYAPKVSRYREQHAGVLRFPSIELTREVQFPLPLPCWPPIHRAIGRSRLQVVHTHHPVLLGDYAWYWARRLKIPLVYTFHTQYEQYVHYAKLPQAPVRALTRWWVAQFARRCDLLIAPSPSIQELLLDYGIRTWTVTLPNAIDLGHFQIGPRRESLRQKLGWPQEASIALYAGRLAKEKNLEFMLHAFQPVALESPRALCVIVGDGPERENLQRLAHHLQIADQVLFPGRVPYAEMADYFRAASFFCISSVTEVKPLVVLEALASGLPVLAVAACGTQDTLTDGFDGILTPHQAEAFGDRWRELVQNPERVSAMAHNAQKTAQQYSIQEYTRRLTQLYSEAIRRIR